MALHAALPTIRPLHRAQDAFPRPPCALLWAQQYQLCSVPIFRRSERCAPRHANSPAAGEPIEKTAAELLRENLALRRELAKLQGVQADEVTFSLNAAIKVPEVSQASAPSQSEPGSFQPRHVKEETRKDQAQAQSLAAQRLATQQELEEGIKWPSSAQHAFWEHAPRRKHLSIGDASPSGASARDERTLHVVHMAAEMAPIAKVGGLGDVVTGLARACIERGHAVEVMLPYYESLPDEGIQDLQHSRDLECPKGKVWDGVFQRGSLKTSAFRGKIDGIPVVLLRPDWGVCNIFRGGAIYGGAYNELEAYLYFSRACLEYLRVEGKNPDIIHAHEWQLSAIPMLYWEVYHSTGMGRPRVVLTIHNMDNSGECRQDEFAFAGLPGDAFATVDRALDERTIGHNPERLCLMKGGIVYSNVVTTVSPTYAKEALEGGAAGWLRATLAKPEVSSKFKGVLNGIDTALWDPAKDPLIAAPFSADQLDGKALCKRYLQQGLGLDITPDKPIVACITRLVPQKGIHLIRHSIYRTVELGGQFVLLGSGHADGDFRALAEGEFRDSKDVKIMVMYSEALAHQIYAAADIVLVPSLFEPCGLTQLVGMRYGAIPVVRSTGGLADTVTDVDADPRNGNGYCFGGMDAGALNSALDRALTTFREDKSRWQQLSQQNMSLDWSWQRSATSYIELYNQVQPAA
ncbi:hypothetical protein CVIRNUC_001816 [Coccomyxa viridis]|uniref:starch synthase n=1 Tax=Coccomyxa viridis TaxID=1274662 RepID=A0AAV1HWN6_9CHLO|nr:hypothetical protein CVIRNUC_001816 [Coccomyxa viridis]